MNNSGRNQPQLPSDNLSATILVARGGDKEHLGRLFEAFRGRLRASAERELQQKLQVRFDASDIVQQTLLSAFNNFADFQGDCEAELVAWLEQIQKRNILDAVRLHVRSGKRSVDREQPNAHMGAGISNFADEHIESPSHAAMASDERRRLMLAIEHLPPDQQEVVRMRHLEGKTLAEIMAKIGRSREATAALIKRGLANLRRQIQDPE